jgi:hypothetical protein
MIFFSPQDYWFFKQLDVSPLKTKNMTVHLMKVINCPSLVYFPTLNGYATLLYNIHRAI